MIAVRLESLGKEHTLFLLAEELHNSLENSEQAIKGVGNAIREKKLAEAEVEIAKENLILRYEINYLDARKKYGRRMADTLFPRTYSQKAIADIEENVEDVA